MRWQRKLQRQWLKQEEVVTEGFLSICAAQMSSFSISVYIIPTQTKSQYGGGNRYQACKLAVSKCGTATAGLKVELTLVLYECKS